MTNMRNFLKTMISDCYREKISQLHYLRTSLNHKKNLNLDCSMIEQICVSRAI